MPEKRKRPFPFQFEYVTSTLSLINGWAITTNIINDSATDGQAQVVIYTDGGATQADSGVLDVHAGMGSGMSDTVREDGDFWVRVFVSSESLIPYTQSSRYDEQMVLWVPIVMYKPGDYAVFKWSETGPDQFVRSRIW